MRSLAFAPEPRGSRSSPAPPPDRCTGPTTAATAGRPAGLALPAAGLGRRVAGLRRRPTPDRLWAGLRGIWGGGAVVVSDDLGATWQVRSVRDDALYALATVPGASGSAGDRHGDRGLGSDDEGASWRHLTAAHPEIVEVSSLLVAARCARDDARRHLPACLPLGRRRRHLARRLRRHGARHAGLQSPCGRPGTPARYGPRPAVGSTAATTWAAAGTAYREGLGERRTPSFEVLPNGRLLAGTVAGVYSSDDGGATWRGARATISRVLAIAHAEGAPRAASSSAPRAAASGAPTTAARASCQPIAA